MKNIKIIPITEISNKDLDKFLLKIFNMPKLNFFKKYDEWLSKGDENRFILIVNNKPAAYFAIIPTNIMVEVEVEQQYGG